MTLWYSTNPIGKRKKLSQELKINLKMERRTRTLMTQIRSQSLRNNLRRSI